MDGPFEVAYLLCPKDSLQNSSLNPCSGKNWRAVSEQLHKPQSLACCCIGSGTQGTDHDMVECGEGQEGKVSCISIGSV